MLCTCMCVPLTGPFTEGARSASLATPPLTTSKLCRSEAQAVRMAARRIQLSGILLYFEGIQRFFIKI